MNLFRFIFILLFCGTVMAKDFQLKEKSSDRLVQKKKEAGLCAAFYYSSVKKIALANGNYDKFKHCSISCMLTLRCPSIDVLELGVLKEVIDLVGPGNADLEDIEADYTGVAFARNQKATTDQGCIRKCHKVYPESCK